MNRLAIIHKTKKFVHDQLLGESTGHDWWHIYRVWQLSKRIARTETGVDIFIVELGSLLHDISDWKFNGGNEKGGSEIAREWLKNLAVDSEIVDRVTHIVDHVSFKGAGEKNTMKTKEGFIVQDADRLDALGAIGIARTFAYGGHVGREIYNPDINPVLHSSFEEYKKNNGPSLNHFYEKLLLLKDNMNTTSAKKIALKRHMFMEAFLEEFYAEWEGEI